jgi:LCP family protein required for cell wall assembly
MRRVMTFRRIAAFGVGMLLLGLLVGGVAGVRARRFAAATFRADDRPAMVALPDDPPATAPPPTAAVATSVPQGLATPRGQAAPVSTATRAPVPVGTPTAAVPPLGYAGTPLSARLRAGRPLALLLLGYGGPGHDGAFLTDSLEVARLDPTSGAITLIGVPRDLWVQIPATGDGRGGYWGKINEAFAVGVGPRGDYATGGALASKAVAQVLGIPIDAWVALDFDGFRRAVDALGGVDVDVAQAFTDDHYPNNDDADIDPSYKTIHFDAGVQHLDGETALEFARSRYAPEDGSDFGRARRQQLLIAAAARQLATPTGVARAFGVLGALEGHLHTGLSAGEARDLAGWAQEQAAAGVRPRFGTAALDTAALLVAATSDRGQYILLPVAGQGNYGAIRAYVQQQLAFAATTPGAPTIPWQRRRSQRERRPSGAQCVRLGPP